MTSGVLRFSIVVLSVLLAQKAVAQAVTMAVTMADLAGVSVEAEIARDQVVRREGRSFNVHLKQTWDIAVGEDQKAVTTKVGTTTTTPRGTRTARPNIGVFILGEPRQIPSRGGGSAMWEFADGTLTFTRTFPSGAFRAHFVFTRGPDGLACAATEAFARENGGRPIRLQSAFGDGEVVMISAKQVGARCRIVKAQ
jgi:ribosomal protein L36